MLNQGRSTPFYSITLFIGSQTGRFQVQGSEVTSDGHCLPYLSRSGV